jgi:hypothetical protein
MEHVPFFRIGSNFASSQLRLCCDSVSSLARKDCSLLFHFFHEMGRARGFSGGF